MGNYYTPFSLRIDEELIEKLRLIARVHLRSTNKEIEYALTQYVESFEQMHGALSDLDL